MPVKKKRSPEAILQDRVLSWLKTTGLLFWRQNSGKVPVPTGKRTPAGKPVFRFINLGRDGLPDIIVVVPPGGRFLGMELKSAKGKLRETQETFRDQVLSVGGLYHEVRSLDQAKEVLLPWLKATPTSQSKASPKRSASLH